MEKSQRRGGTKRPRLRGAPAIAAYLNMPVRQTYYALEHNAIPAGKFLGTWMADPDRLDQHMDDICSGRRT